MEKSIFVDADSSLMQLIHFEDGGEYNSSLNNDMDARSITDFIFFRSLYEVTDTSLSRKFTIDLTSKLIYCSGDAVSCMVSQ